MTRIVRLLMALVMIVTLFGAAGFDVPVSLAPGASAIAQACCDGDCPDDVECDVSCAMSSRCGVSGRMIAPMDAARIVREFARAEQVLVVQLPLPGVPPDGLKRPPRV
jgi:hypothetical protein